MFKMGFNVFFIVRVSNYPPPPTPFTTWNLLLFSISACYLVLSVYCLLVCCCGHHYLKKKSRFALKSLFFSNKAATSPSSLFGFLSYSYSSSFFFFFFFSSFILFRLSQSSSNVKWHVTWTVNEFLLNNLWIDALCPERPQSTIKDGEPKTATSTFTQLLPEIDTMCDTGRWPIY